MKQSLLISLSFFISLISFGQSDVDKLNDLQTTLDQIQYNLGEGDNVDQRIIEEEIGKLKKVVATNDSLALVVNLLQAEVLLYKSKLAFCKDFNTGSASDSILEHASLVTSVFNVDGTVSTLKISKGSYVIVESDKAFSECEKFIKSCKVKYPKLNFILVKNPNNSWNHVCVAKAFNKAEVGNEVARYRALGFTDAWHLIFE